MKDQITPSVKSDAINGELDLLSQIIWNGKDRRTCIEEGICLTCDDAKGIKATSFRDDIFGVSEPDDEDWPDEPQDEHDPWDNQWADDDALGSAGMGTDEYYF